jgi:hypothetical protein
MLGGHERGVNAGLNCHRLTHLLLASELERALPSQQQGPVPTLHCQGDEFYGAVATTKQIAGNMRRLRCPPAIVTKA